MKQARDKSGRFAGSARKENKQKKDEQKERMSAGEQEELKRMADNIKESLSDFLNSGTVKETKWEQAVKPFPTMKEMTQVIDENLDGFKNILDVLTSKVKDVSAPLPEMKLGSAARTRIVGIDTLIILNDRLVNLLTKLEAVTKAIRIG